MPTLWDNFAKGLKTIRPDGAKNMNGPQLKVALTAIDDNINFKEFGVMNE